MTLTVEDVKNVRFRIAKRVGEGYQATEVDDFVDKVDATFTSMVEENERLKAQLDSLDRDNRDGGQVLVGTGETVRTDAVATEVQPAEVHPDEELVRENERLRTELEGARAAEAGSEAEAELERLRRENTELISQLEANRAELEQARAATGLTVIEGNESGAGRIEKIVVTTAAQASPAVTRLVQLATEQAESVVGEANAEAARTMEQAERDAHELTVDAQTRAERVQSEARVNADQVTSEARALAERLQNEAQARSDALGTEVAERRRALFTELEGERDQLVGRVGELRSFENSYRSNLVQHLRAQLQVVESSDLEPTPAPELAAGAPQQATPQQAGQQGGTPRLDALLSEEN